MEDAPDGAAGDGAGGDEGDFGGEGGYDYGDMDFGDMFGDGGGDYYGGDGLMQPMHGVVDLDEVTLPRMAASQVPLAGLFFNTESEYPVEGLAELWTIIRDEYVNHFTLLLGKAGIYGAEEEDNKQYVDELKDDYNIGKDFPVLVFLGAPEPYPVLAITNATGDQDVRAFLDQHVGAPGTIPELNALVAETYGGAAGAEEGGRRECLQRARAVLAEVKAKPVVQKANHDKMVKFTEYYVTVLETLAGGNLGFPDYEMKRLAKIAENNNEDLDSGLLEEFLLQVNILDTVRKTLVAGGHIEAAPPPSAAEAAAAAAEGEANLKRAEAAAEFAGALLEEAQGEL